MGEGGQNRINKWQGCRVHWRPQWMVFTSLEVVKKINLRSPRHEKKNPLAVCGDGVNHSYCADRKESRVYRRAVIMPCS